MARLSLHGRGTIVTLIVLAWTPPAAGQITALHVVRQPTPADVLPGYVANDVLLDFDGRYAGSQMVIELTSGEIYQNVHPGRPGSAAHTPPASFLLPLDPTMAWDTFVANGGATTEDTEGTVGIAGAAIGIAEFYNGMGTNRPFAISTTAADIGWFANVGQQFIDDRDGFMIARITLSDDATGTFQYRGAAGGVIGFPGDQTVVRPIRNGAIIPEPSTVALVIISVIGLFLLKGSRA